MKYLKVFLNLVIVLLFLLLSVIVFLQIPQFRDRIVAWALPKLNNEIAGRILIKSVDGDLLSGLDINGLTVIYHEKPLVSIAEVKIRWNLLAVLSREFDVTQVFISNVDGEITKQKNGKWDLAEALAPQKNAEKEPKQEKGNSSWGVKVDEVRINGASIRLQDENGQRRSFSIGTVSAALALNRNKLEVRVKTLEGTSSKPDITVTGAAGEFKLNRLPPRSLQWDALLVKLKGSRVLSSGRIELNSQGRNAVLVDADPLAPQDLNRLGSPVTIPLKVRFESDGSWSKMDWRFAVETTAGTLHANGTATVPFTTPTTPDWKGISLRLTGNVEQLVPAKLFAEDTKRLTRISTRFEISGDRLGYPARGVEGKFDGKKSLIGGYPVRAFAGSFDSTGKRINGKLTLRSVRADVRARGKLDFASSTYAANLRIRRLRPEDWLGARWAGHINLAARFEGRGFKLEKMRAQGKIQIQDSKVGPYLITKIQSPFQLSGGQIRIRQATIDTNVLDARLNGRLPIRKSSSGQMNLLVRAEDLALFFPGPATQAVTGRAMLHARAYGSLERLKIESVLHGMGLKYQEALIPDLDVVMEGHRLNLLTREGAIEATASLSAPRYGETEFENVSAAFSLDRTIRSQEGTFWVTVVKEGIENRIRGRFEIDTPGVQFVLEDFAVSTNGTQWVNHGDAVIDLRSNDIHVQNLDLRNGEQQILIDGRLSPEGTQNLRVRLNRIQLAQLGPLFRPDIEMAGQLDGSIWLTGSLEAPMIESTLALAEGTFGGYQLQLATAVLNYRNRWLETEVHLMQKASTGMISGSARLPIDLGRIPQGGSRLDSRKLSGRIVSKNLSLKIVQAVTDNVDNVKGEVNMDIRLAGTMRQPLFNGEVGVANATARIRKIGVQYEAVSVRAVLHNRTISLQQLQIRSGKKGSLTATGEFVFPTEADSGHLGVRFRGDNFLVVDNELAVARVDADLTITGDIANPVVAGSISPQQVVITPPKRSDKKLEPVVFNYPGIHVIEAGGVQTTQIPVTGVTQVKVSSITGASVNVVVLLERNIWIRNDDMNVEWTGRVSAFKEPGDEKLRFEGIIETNRGFYRLQGKRLEIQQGRIVFTGTDEINPQLDITLTYSVTDYFVTAHVTGTMRKPDLELASDPPLEQADILAVLLFGKPFDRLGQGEQVAMRERVGQALGGFAASELRKQLGGQLGIDTFEISPSGEGTGEPGGPTVGVGKYVSEDVFVQYLQKFGIDAGSEVRIEYYFTKHWLIQTSAATSGQSGADVFWHLSF